MTEQPSFSKKAWQDNQPRLDMIFKLPFIQKLADGSLDREIFKGYILQDAYYLEQYARTLAIAASKAVDHESMVFLSGSLVESIAIEQALHQEYFAAFGLDKQAVLRTEASPTCVAYTSYLVAVSQCQSVEVAIAAILPCFWIYLEVGKYIAMNTVVGNPYAKWIETYSDPLFAEATDKAIALTDRMARRAPEQVPAMRRAFDQAVRYEWMFWDAAWRQEEWPL